MGLEVLVVRTGTANLASVCAGLRRIDAVPRLTESATEIRAADRVVLPGVGALGAAMRRLETLGLVDVLADRVRDGRPTLAVCLGLQLLCEASDESPGVAGLGVVTGRVTRFAEGVRIPQLGWNRVVSQQDGDGFEPGYAYFANSYKLDVAPDGWHWAASEHAGRFVAAMWRGAVLACQFHPELSGAWGLALLRRWIAAGKEAPAC